MKISLNTILSLGVHAGCAVTNAYLSPVSFTLSFAVGVIAALGVGIKRGFDLVYIDLNEKLVQKLKEKSQAVLKTQQPIDEQISSFLEEYINKIPAVARPIFKGFLYFSGYHNLYNKARQMIGNFDEQRQAIIEKLNPVPGKTLTLVALAALAANLNYLPYPVLSKLYIFSGYPVGYSAGKFILQYFDFYRLKVNPP